MLDPNKRPNEQDMMVASFIKELQCLGSVDGFINQAVNNQIVLTQTSTTDVWTYKANTTTLLALTITYTDSTKATIANVKRTA